MITNRFKNSFAENIFNLKYRQGVNDTWDALCERLVEDVCGSRWGTEKPLMSTTDQADLIQYMKEMEYIDIKDGIIILIKEFNYNENMGQEAMKYQLSSNCISKLLSKPADYLYLNLRITL